MMKRLLLLTPVILLSVLVSLSSAPPQLNPQQGHGAPSGTCLGPYVDTDTGNLYVCKVGQYVLNGSAPVPVLGVNIKNAPYNAVGDGKFFVDGVSNAGNNQLTSVTATFAASDVGHNVFCTKTPFSNTANAWAAGNSSTVASFINASTITYSGTNAGVNSGMACIITNPADATAISTAFTACKSTSPAPASQGPIQSLGCNLYIPTGIYGVSATLDNLISTGNEPCVGIIGDGMGKTVLAPVSGGFTYSNHSGWFIHDRCASGNLRNFSIELASVPVNFGGLPAGAIEFFSSNGVLDNVAVFDQCNTNGAISYGIDAQGGTNVKMYNPTVINNGNCGAGNSNGGLNLNNVSQINIYSPFLSNTNQNLKVQNAASGANGSGTVIYGGVIDEGSVTSVVASQDVWFEGTTLTGGANCITVDATSFVWMYGGYCGTFGGNTGSGPTVASGGVLNMTAVHVNGVNASNYCYNATALGGIFDLGGNRCTLSGGATTYKSTSANLVFPLTTQAQTQLGGQQVVSGAVPTACSITGNGTSTCAFDTGSTDAAGRITITAAGTTTAVGLVSFNYSATYGTNSTNCSANYLSGTGAWAIGAIAPIFITSTTTAASFNINNAGTNLTATSTYKVNYTCYGQ